MKPSSEIEFLREVLRTIENPPKEKRWLSAVLNIGIWIVVFCVSMAYFMLGTPGHWTHGLVALTCLLLGVELTRGFYSTCQKAQWPLLSQHLDAEKIRARISELGA